MPTIVPRPPSPNPVYAVGDIFRIRARHLSTSGTITKINKMNLLYDSVYMTGEILHLKLARHEMVHAEIGTPPQTPTT